MQRAQESVEPSTSSMIKLVQETKDDVQRGFLIYLSVYKQPGDATPRFIGWMYAAFQLMT
jgi:CHASE1-domain containing sensor protein